MMNESQKHIPFTHAHFLHRFTKNLLWGLFIIAFSLFMGILGYRFIEGFSWVDAYFEASMILSGMGSVLELHTTEGKIFAGLFALYSGCALLLTISIVLAPVLSRFLHKFHLDLEASKKN